MYLSSVWGVVRGRTLVHAGGVSSPVSSVTARGVIGV